MNMAKVRHQPLGYLMWLLESNYVTKQLGNFSLFLRHKDKLSKEFDFLKKCLKICVQRHLLRGK